MVNLLKELVHLESPSNNRKAVNKCTAYLAQVLRKNGAKVTRFPQENIGDLYLAEYPAKRSKDRLEQILLLTHIDTVWPVGKIEGMPFYLSGKNLYGPGVLDMKAGVVVAAYALKTMNDLNIIPDKRIALFINSAEEIGNANSYAMIEKLAKKSSKVLCLEPSLPGGALKIQRKGRLVVRLLSSGKAAHAGNPSQGVNAIEEMMLQIRGLSKLRTKETTVNIGLISGGEKANIVAEKAEAVLDIRFWNNNQKQKILDYFKQLAPCLPGAQIKHKVESLTPPMEKTKRSAQLLAEVQDIADSLGLKLEAGKTGGGSDASIASNIGVPTLDGLGPDGNGIHAENEHLILPSLVERAALLTELLCRL